MPLLQHPAAAVRQAAVAFVAAAARALPPADASTQLRSMVLPRLAEPPLALDGALAKKQPQPPAGGLRTRWVTPVRLLGLPWQVRSTVKRPATAQAIVAMGVWGAPDTHPFCSPFPRAAPADEQHLASLLKPAGDGTAADPPPAGTRPRQPQPMAPLLGLYTSTPQAGDAAAGGGGAPAPPTLLLQPSAPLYSVELDPIVLGAGDWGRDGSAALPAPPSLAAVAAAGYGFRSDGFSDRRDTPSGGAGTPTVRISSGAGGSGAPSSGGVVGCEGGVRARARSAHTAAVDSLGLRLVALEERRAALADRLGRGDGGDELGGRQELERLTAAINRRVDAVGPARAWGSWFALPEAVAAQLARPRAASRLQSVAAASDAPSPTHASTCKPSPGHAPTPAGCASPRAPMSGSPAPSRPTSCSRWPSATRPRPPATSPGRAAWRGRARARCCRTACSTAACQVRAASEGCAGGRKSLAGCKCGALKCQSSKQQGPCFRASHPPPFPSPLPTPQLQKPPQPWVPLPPA